MSVAVPFGGGCACGAIRYKCSAPPAFMFQCHCRDCQRATGGPFAANVWFETAALVFHKEPKDYVVEADNGATVYHYFCPDCGSPLGMRSAEFTTYRGIRAASLDDPSWLSPVANLWTCRAYPWEPLNPELREFETQPNESEFGAILEEVARRS